MIKQCFLVIGLLLICESYAKANFDYNANCDKAYHCILSFKLNEGRTLIDKEKAVHPNNGIIILLDNYYDFFYLLTTENRADFERLIEHKATRIDELEKNDDASPYYKFSIAQVNLQWALLNSRFGNYTSAGFEINKAYRLLQGNVKKFPSFAPNNIPLGVVNVLLGSLPGGPLKSILSFLGVSGDTQTGLKMLEGLAENPQHLNNGYFYDELVFYLTYIQTDVVNDALAYQKMCRYINLIDSSSLLKNYIGGYISLRTGHTPEAINWLQTAPYGKEYQLYPYLDYLLGLAKMNKGDNEAAVNYFNKFLLNYHGVNFIKDAYLHLAWSAILNDDLKGYRYFVQQVKIKGNLYHDKDKQAFDEANDDVPDVSLLKARLLFDGGYYNQSLALLLPKKESEFKLARDQIDRYYRMARINDAMGRDDQAIKLYQITIDKGRLSKYHYAATSAIKMGAIFERRKELAAARKAYQLVFTFDNQQFKNSLEQKAREGLKRLGQ